MILIGEETSSPIKLLKGKCKCRAERTSGGTREVTLNINSAGVISQKSLRKSKPRGALGAGQQKERVISQKMCVLAFYSAQRRAMGHYRRKTPW